MKRAIGVIDSGVGGLTVVNELMRQLPHEKLIYVGDTLRCPYGSRTKEEVIQFTMDMVHFLLKQDIKLIVIACNTATAFALEHLKKTLSIPIVGVIQPGARAAIKATQTNHIGIIGTEGTINSGAYSYALKQINQDISVTSLACPSFVPMVEKGILEGERALSIVKNSLHLFENIKMMDTLILGCTHYPLIEKTIQHVVGERIKLISSSDETARETSAILDVHHLLNEEKVTLSHHFYATGDITLFRNIAQTLFNKEMTHLKTVEIEKVVF